MDSPDAELDITIDDDHPFVVFSCEGVTTGLRSYVSAHDWLIDVSVADDSFAFPRHFQCAGDIEDMGTSFDATRYFWDMLTDEDVSFGKLVDIYDRVDPRNWAKTRDYVLVARNPFRRLQAAADAEGVLAKHAAQADNGVSHGP